MSWLGKSGKPPPIIVQMDEEKRSLLKELAEDNEYWESALNFVNSTGGKDFHSLTDKQADWLTSIMAELEVRLNRRTARELFKEVV